MTVTDIQNALLKYKRPLALFVAIVVLMCHFYLGIEQTHTAAVYIKYVGENAENASGSPGRCPSPGRVRSIRALCGTSPAGISRFSVKRSPSGSITPKRCSPLSVNKTTR